MIILYDNVYDKIYVSVCVCANETAYSNYTDTYTMYTVYNNNTRLSLKRNRVEETNKEKE
jgi:hypothetical protein